MSKKQIPFIENSVGWQVCKNHLSRGRGLAEGLAHDLDAALRHIERCSTEDQHLIARTLHLKFRDRTPRFKAGELVYEERTIRERLVAYLIKLSLRGDEG